MAQSTTSVTGSAGGSNPTPPTNLAFVGCRPPLDPLQAAVDDGIPYWLSGGLLTNLMTFNENAGGAGGPTRTVFAAKTAAAGSGVSNDHEGKGNETLFTQTYSSAIYAPVTLTTVGCGPNLTPGTMPIPNQLHASSLSPATNPALTTIAPTTAVSGATGTDTITCTGTNFTPQSVVYVNGVRMPTTYVSATSITAVVTKKTSAGAVPVNVITGGVVGTASQTLTYS